MPKPKEFKTKTERERHARALERRRARHHEKRTIAMASQAAEGDANFEALLEAERVRMAETHQQKIATKGGSTPPKVTTQARDNLAMAFDLMGGVPALVVWGRKNTTEFYRLWARLIPREAAETSQTLPLEDLLSKLASREHMSVAEAAMDIGHEQMLAAREKAAGEEEPVLYKGETVQ